MSDHTADLGTPRIPVQSAMQDTRVLGFHRRSGAMQLALDERALRSAGSSGIATARVYGWQAPGTVTLGYAQSPDVVDRVACEDADLEVTRRQSGGGVIYHHPMGDVSFSVAMPRDGLPGGIEENYRAIIHPVLAALETVGVPAELASTPAPGVHESFCFLREVHEAYDIVVPDSGAPGGMRKLAGCAQHRTQDAILQHGSLRYVGIPEREVSVLEASIDPDTVDARTAAILEAGGDRTRLIRALVESFEDWLGTTASESWPASDFAAAERLRDRKYRDPSWVTHRELPTD